MATQFAVDLVFKSQGLGKLDQATKKLQGIDGASKNAANSIRPIGGAAKSAAVGVKGLGAAFNAALGPIGAALAAISSLTAAFNVLSQQDFAEAKFRSLGGSSAELNEELKKVSAELNGQASVVELTGAAYDVASAGFSKAADAAKVLKAASLGATGGFSDINTVGNAATSVLNAYGLSASEAGRLVDQFIQTQNDGKIVVAEYASNIGKVASAAAGLKIPLEEINAVIAQSTASGVQAEVAFTGLKGALARLASGEASKALADFGIEIDSASLASDGLLGTLKKLKGLDTGTIFKALGTEAGPALLPILNNLERFEELIENQKNSVGAAAKAQVQAAETIQGAWKAVTTEFQNLFADQSELGQAIIVILKASAVAVKGFAFAVNQMLKPFKEAINIATAFGKKLEEVFGVSAAVKALQQQFEYLSKVFQVIGDAFRSAFLEQVMNGVGRLTAAWNQLVGFMTHGWNNLVSFMTAKWNELIGSLNNALGFFGTSVAEVVNWLGGAWSSLINFMGNAWTNFLRDAVAKFVTFTNPIGIVLKAMGVDVGEAFVSGLESAIGGIQNISFGGIAAPAIGGNGGTQATTIPTPTPTPTAGGGGGGSNAAAKELERQNKLYEDLLLKSKQLIEDANLRTQALEGQTEKQKILAEEAKKEIEINRQFNELLTQAEEIKDAGRRAEVRSALEKGRVLELNNLVLETETAISELKQNALTSIQEENALLLAKIQGKEREYQLQKQINDLVKAGGGTITSEEASALVRQNEALKEQAKSAEELKSAYEGLAGSISGEVTGALRSVIDGTKSVDQAFADMLKGIADKFIDMAMQILQDAMTKQLMQLFGSLLGGGGGGGGVSSGAFSIGLGSTFEGGGYTGSAPRTGGIDGKGGFPAIMHPQETVIDHTDINSSMGRYGSGGNNAPMLNMSFQTTQFMDRDWVDKEQLMAAMQATQKRSVSQSQAKTFGTLRNSRSQRSRIGL